jgi:hypothetical protein
VHIHVLQAPGPSGQWQADAGNTHAPVLPHPAIAQGSAPSAGSRDRVTRAERPSGRHAANQGASPGASVTTPTSPDGQALLAAAQAPATARPGSAAGPAPGAQSSPASGSGTSSGSGAGTSSGSGAGAGSGSGSSGGSGPLPGLGTGPSSGPAPVGAPVPSPSPITSSGSGICVTLGPLGVCLDL